PSPSIASPRVALDDGLQDPDGLRTEAAERNNVAKTTILHDCSTDSTDGSERPAGTAGLSLSYIADTRYFPELAEHYRADVVIMNVVRLLPSDLDHLHAPDAEELVKAIRPKLAVLSHFGMKMLAARPWVIAREMSERTGCKVVAATDGMLVDLEMYKATSPKPQATGNEGDNRLWVQSPSEDLGDSPSGGAE
ncbi:MAG: hypothetical protein NTX53_18280, partial [candidate division WOR-3 bacterium]|nr:hypothetical protein [candidate division WOR-3 bacterium]